jgi:DNA-binding transcriptional regulator YdaS (Cro superfamily)
MKLLAYLQSNRIADADFAAHIGVSEGAVRKWKYGERIPRAEAMVQVLRATNGAVTPNDFLIDGPAAEPAREAAA